MQNAHKQQANILSQAIKHTLIWPFSKSATVNFVDKKKNLSF